MNVVNHRLWSEYRAIDALLGVPFSLGIALISDLLFDSISLSSHINIQHTSRTVNNTVNTTLLSHQKTLSDTPSLVQTSTGLLEMHSLFQEASEAEEIPYEGE